MTEVYVIANPVSGAFSNDFFNRVLRELEPFAPTSYMTGSPGDATSFARDCPEGSLIVCIGGDGTLNEVVNGIAGSGKALVIAGGGTGSDLGKTLGIIPPEKLRDALKSPRISKVDLALVKHAAGARYFANVMEIGFGASVMARVNSRRRGIGNPFTSSVLRELPRLKCYNVQIDSGAEKREMQVIEVVIANGRFFGGGMLASPYSDPSDGVLDLHAVSGMSRLSLIRRFGKLKSGEYVDLEDVLNISSPIFSISGDKAPFEIDGECIGNTPVEISTVTGALNVVRGEDIEHRKAIS